MIIFQSVSLFFCEKDNSICIYLYLEKFYIKFHLVLEFVNWNLSQTILQQAVSIVSVHIFFNIIFHKGWKGAHCSLRVSVFVGCAKARFCYKSKPFLLRRKPYCGRDFIAKSLCLYYLQFLVQGKGSESDKTHTALDHQSSTSQKGTYTSHSFNVTERIFLANHCSYSSSFYQIIQHFPFGYKI